MSKFKAPMNASEALYAFAGWLECTDPSVKMGAKEDCREVVELVSEFIKANNLPDVRDGWSGKVVTHPNDKTGRYHADIPSFEGEVVECRTECGTEEM